MRSEQKRLGSNPSFIFSMNFFSFFFSSPFLFLLLPLFPPHPSVFYAPALFELTSSYTDFSHKRISCVSLIHIKITRFKIQEDQIHFISSYVYLIECISALLVRRMHSISVQKQNNLLLFQKTIAVTILNFYR